jgi:hypothetical protein
MGPLFAVTLDDDLHGTARRGVVQEPSSAPYI